MDKLISGSDTHKMLSLLLENYKNMLKSMHQNTNERARIKKMIEELEFIEQLQNVKKLVAVSSKNHPNMHVLKYLDILIVH